MIYSKETKAEYLDNGHYIIDNKEYMSLWKYKKENDDYVFSDKNSETAEILKKRYTHRASKPDEGKWNQVLIFRKEDLLKYYKKNNE